jgi:hypothetical protein
LEPIYEARRAERIAMTTAPATVAAHPLSGVNYLFRP